MPLYVKHSDTVKVPKITGMNVMEASRIVQEVGLEIKQGDIKYDENIPIGEILDQNPPADETVKYGRRIYVTICGGEQLSEVPNLVGRSLRDAKFALDQRGIKLGETVRKSTNEYPADFVVSQIIQPGSRVKRNSEMDLILSDGPFVGDLKVPNIKGKTLEEAKKIITDSKLKLGKITYQTNNELPPGQIIDQYPKVDKSANENTQVDLFVARKKVIIEKVEEEADEDGSTAKEDKVQENDDTKKTDPTKDKPKVDIKPVPTEKPADKNTDKSPPVKKDEGTKNNNDKKKDSDEGGSTDDGN
jgi:beta-lactam-binding protein with PASTA domain